MLEALAVLAAGVWAGAINTVVGSGTLVTFPVLLAVGYPPVVANVSNNIGLIGGTMSGVWGYRRELAGQRSRIWKFGSMSLLGGITGAILLLQLPDDAFEVIVPVLIAIALVLIVLQKRLQAWIAARRAAAGESGRAGDHDGPFVRLAVFGTGVYGGYFGAAQGIILLSFLGLALDDELQRINGLKNVLAGTVNLVAGVVFLFIADISWTPALLIFAGAVLGGQLGARYGRRLPPDALRALIVVVGLAAIVQLVR
ncbi:MAG TPA: sulfite exporter TauE/SafE family protein [Solirubrobacteraceae bacterium]|nr:sulfite exporter TauE/SafE family protein [Solirubrobacteraceae bacterium]